MPDLQITMANHISASAAQSALSIQELVTTMKTAGMADTAIRQTLLNDLNTGGPLFGSFRNKLKNTVKNGVEVSSNGSANGKFTKAGVSQFQWVSVGEGKVCTDCEERHGETGTMEYFETIGLPASGFSVCTTNCRCQLLPENYKGENLDKPLVKSRVPIEDGVIFKGNKQELTKSFNSEIADFSQGKKITAYHGSNRKFDKFSIQKSRSDANASFQGDGIFFTTDKGVAKQYASASRNANFDKDILREIRKIDNDLGQFADDLYNIGDDAWGDSIALIKKIESKGFDVDDLGQVIEWVAGSKTTMPSGGGTAFEMFSNSTLSVPDHILKMAEKLGVKDNLLNPNVYKVEITGKNILVTSSQSASKSALKNGYDAVIYTGSGTVDSMAEIIIYNENAITIKSIENIK